MCTRALVMAATVAGVGLYAPQVCGNANLETPPVAEEVQVGGVLGTEFYAASVEGTDQAVAAPLVDWGRLSLEMADSWCGRQPGETLTVLLRVSELLDEINAVQAVFEYDEETLALDGILGGDGAGSPWDSGMVLYDEAEPGIVVAGIALFSGKTAADAVVARIDFVALPNDSVATTDVQLLAEVYPFTTKLTLASDGSPIIPELGGPMVIAHRGDSDADGDIDLIDYQDFDSCLDGPGAPDDRIDCCWFDFDRDGDVDLADFAGFARVFSGS